MLALMHDPLYKEVLSHTLTECILTALETFEMQVNETENDRMDSPLYGVDNPLGLDGTAG
jgi:hypothetical protein